MKLHKERHLSCIIKWYFWGNFSLVDWQHRGLKNTVDLLLFYWEHFYEFSESLKNKPVHLQYKFEWMAMQKSLA